MVRKTIVREVKTLRALQHEHVVRLYAQRGIIDPRSDVFRPFKDKRPTPVFV